MSALCLGRSRHALLKAVATALAVPLLTMAATSAAIACTIFTAEKGGKVLVGNNEDTDSTVAMVWFDQAAQGKFGKMMFGVAGKYPQGGMNDQGLFFDYVASGAYKPCPALPGQVMPGPSPAGIPVTSPPTLDETVKSFMAYGSTNDRLLETCRTVDDALEFYKTHYESGFGYATLMVVDKQANSALVTWDWTAGKLKVERAKGFKTLGYGQAIGVFRRPANSYEVSIDGFRSLCAESRQGRFTQYSNVYDLNAGVVYTYRSGMFDKPIVLDLKSELAKGAHTYDLDQLVNTKKSDKAH